MVPLPARRSSDSRIHEGRYKIPTIDLLAPLGVFWNTKEVLIHSNAVRLLLIPPVTVSVMSCHYSGMLMENSIGSGRCGRDSRTRKRCCRTAERLPGGGGEEESRSPPPKRAPWAWVCVGDGGIQQLPWRKARAPHRRRRRSPGEAGAEVHTLCEGLRPTRAAGP